MQRARTAILGLLISSVAAVAQEDAPERTLGELLKTFRSEFVHLTPGERDFPKTFLMGPPSASHNVDMESAFWICKYEVTQDLYQAVMGSNPSRWKGPRNSAEMFDWNDAVTFCGNASRSMRARGLISEKQIVRLPTEAEWEYACRAGTRTAYSFGDDSASLDNYGWFKGNAAGNDPPVGAKKPNQWDLYDVHGYLWEWCADREPGSDRRVLRGGAWTSTARECRSDSRRIVPLSAKGPDIGLRCVISNR